jgi:hypothetical protein
MSTGSLEASEAASAAVTVAPRVSLADIEGSIAEEYSFTANKALDAMQFPRPASLPDPLAMLTVCILVTQNGCTVIGKSASHKNVNADFGAKLAREDAIRQLWPLMGFASRDKLYSSVP